MSLWEAFRLDHEESSFAVTTSKRRRRNPSARNEKPSTLQKSKRGGPKVSPRNQYSETDPTPSWIHAYLQVQGGLSSGVHRQLQQKQQWGHRLAQERLFQTKNDRFIDGTNVVYRQREDWSKEQGYVACTMLNVDRVVGWDRSGALDIVRMPSRPKDNTTTKSRPMGTAIVNAWDLKVPEHYGIPKLYPFLAGDALAVGCGNSYHILTNGAARSWAERKDLPRATHTYNDNFAAYVLSGPRRKYERNLQKSEYALRAMIQTHTSAVDLATATTTPSLDYETFLSILPGWNSTTIIDPERAKLPSSPYVPSTQKPISQATQWDFMETGSSLLAARVDPQQDAFWMQLIDDRAPPHRPSVGISRSVPPRYCDEHITAIAFVSSNCLATAHVTCPSSSSSMATPVNINHTKPQMKSSVKIWDIRMASSLTFQNKNNENDPAGMQTVSIPSFPHNMAIGMNPEATKSWPRQNKEQSKPQQNDDSIITDLSSCRKGTLVVTAHSSHLQRVDHYLLHLGSLAWEHIHQHADKRESLYAVAGNHTVLACVAGPASEIQLVDIAARSGGRKSHRNWKNNEQESAQSCRTLPVPLKDRLGLETELSCLAVNRDGSAVVGGSMDGDLFVWRADS